MANYVQTASHVPNPLQASPRASVGLILVVCCALGFFAAVPLALPSLTFVLTIALAKGLAALGVALLLRAGLISLGHAMYFATGAYTVAFLSRAGVSDYVVLLVAAIVISCVSGLVVGAFLARFRAIFFGMLSLAVSMVVFSLLSKLFTITGGTDGMSVAVPTVFGITLTKGQFDLVNYGVTVGLVSLLLLLVAKYLKSPLGEALTAIHSNEIRLEYLGVSAWSVILTGYTLSAALAGLGGALAVLAVGHALPEFAFWTESGHLVLTAVLGGIGSVFGPIAGSIFIEIVHLWANDVAAEAWNMIMGIALLMVIFFLPRGIWSLGSVVRLTSQRRSAGQK